MSTIFARSHTVNTLSWLAVQLNNAAGRINIDQETTINHKRGILDDSGLLDVVDTLPTASYFGLGIGGYGPISPTNNQTPGTNLVVPKASNLDMFTPIPIRVVPKTSYDGNEASFSNYAMREEVSISGTLYVVFWLKKLEFDPATGMTNTSNGNVVNYEQNTDVAITSGSDFYPVPLTPGNSRERITVALRGVGSVSGAELNEFVTNYDVGEFAGQIRTPVINELGIYSGVEDANGDVIGAQLAIHRTFQSEELSTLSRTISPNVVLSNGSGIVSLATQ